MITIQKVNNIIKPLFITKITKPMLKRFLLSVAMLFLTFATYGQEEKHVLFVGNSYTDVNNLPSLIKSIANSCGDDITYESNTPGGCTFMQHCQNQSMSLIRRGGWDIVVLQEQSQYPAFPDEQVAQEVFPYAQQLVDSIYAATPCAEPMFYMTWGRKNGDQRNGEIFPPIGTYEGMDSLLALRYGMMAEQNDASLCPVGRVWHWLRHNHPEIELYQADESHPSTAGSYAAACAFYTLFFHKDPTDIRYDAGLEPPMAEAIRSAVRLIVFDSLAHWQRPQPEASIEMTDTTRYMSESFRLITAHVDSVMIDWGDGMGTFFLPTHSQRLEHIYADTGTYVITIRASRHCMVTELTWSFTAHQEGSEPVGINSPSVNSISLCPNPAATQVELNFAQKPQMVEIIDAQGHIVERLFPQGMNFHLSVGHFANGTYLLRAKLPKGIATSTLVISH